MEYRTLDPSKGELIERFDVHPDDAVEAALGSACRAFADWSRRPIGERTAMLDAAAALLEERTRELADTMALEMGKPLAQGEAEVAKCAWVCRYYAENSAAFLAEREVPTGSGRSSVRFAPLGPILAIMPWNFPLWQFFRFAAPALAAGNVVLLKHAPGTPRCGEAIEELMREAGAPEGTVRNLRLTNEQAARVASDRRVRGVTLTGSTRAGREVAAAAGAHLKKSVMELGGSDPFIVFADADLERAVTTGVQARCLNSGQSCIAAKRFLVERRIYDRFRDRFVAAMQAQRVGDPRQGGTDIGPLARADLRDTLAAHVAASVRAGARIVTGGEIPAGPGFFFPPTVIEGSDPVPAGDAELFGPAAYLVPFGTEEEAVSMANATGYGLGASVWTSDPERAERMVSALEAGSVFVNAMVKSDPRLPFGGTKDSGYGRELGREGQLEFVNVKTVHLEP